MIIRNYRVKRELRTEHCSCGSAMYPPYALERLIGQVVKVRTQFPMGGCDFVWRINDTDGNPWRVHPNWFEPVSHKREAPPENKAQLSLL